MSATTWCWYCGQPLAKIYNGPRRGQLAFRERVILKGQRVRVHGNCSRAIDEDVRTKRREWGSGFHVEGNTDDETN